MVLTNLLNPAECVALVCASDQCGYVPDQPASARDSSSLVAGTQAGLDDRAANFTMLADAALLGPLMDRCRPHLPAALPDGAALVGLNARLRFYRYFPGAVYRPHVDGAWPPSGKDAATKEYVYDTSGGTVKSRFTFLIYLNEGFTGGATTFFTPALEEEGVVEARGVAPRVGSALVFAHGDGSGSLVHEGSALSEGTKYVCRTDVLYTVPPKKTGQDGQARR
jgi:hypothetical protein